MLLLETGRALERERAGLLARRVCWPALAVVLAGALDAWHPPSAAAGRWVLWLDVAALGCVAWALLTRPRLQAKDWRTPVDGRVLAAFTLSALQILAAPHAGPPVLWMRQILSCGVCYYALSARLRRDPGAPGRACENGARSLWRTAALVGAIGCVLHGFAGGLGLEAHEMARLDEPLYFSTTAVTLLILISFARLAWGLRRERPEEAPRWIALAVGFGAVAVMAVLGGTTGGEGLRVLAFMGGAVVVAALDAPRPTRALPNPMTEQALAIAA